MPRINICLQGLVNATGNGPFIAAPAPPAEQESKSNAMTPFKLESTARPADGTEPMEDRYTPGAGAVLQIRLLPESIQSSLCMTAVQSKPRPVDDPAVRQEPLHTTHTITVGCFCACTLSTGSKACVRSAGMPEGQRRASTEAAKTETAAQTGQAFARPEEVSAFRMTRRKRSSSVKAPSEAPPDKGPVAAAKAAEPAAPASSPTDLSDEDVSSKPGVLVHHCSAYE